ncbi:MULTISPECIES: SDR family oxidoreductase [Leeuwenhoekiella]|jgi:glucose 1-dehydrogenase|uniref:Short-chain dehydrogenase/reductase SDR n=1 Tax=Leeuwenhoekiella blandensis (strain CECT 7118 / CCUG 51940 / KCTC 22103 / MED217) TaxID=398720 RepID=A3XI40_LEEBM|nr:MULTISPECIES: SDR family oxidoreductase [Leeuwenhoekiella]EAQ51054.1 Short-chain dehydrogenase/reductase SDR [Leeuwenhoekiella blandensis MED217]MAO42755.1 3-oxoacyl-ACP reductase [Leeuwenhoekiella sp.]HBT10261.1 3-oxoacyl-ACP reductase [Leeuwenhoekiella sp.]|tara:strand:- start:371 stop:1189 length:819 start_codon:yes stop_codon:yes gene_type:complete
MQKPNERLKNQTAIVTGSSTGIGASVALALGRDGANVVVNYNSSEKEAQEVADQINADDTCGEAIIFQCDVSKEDDVKAMFKKTIEKFGTVDILVANSGLQKDAALHEMTLKDWQLVIDVNLTGQFLCAREAIKEFMRRGMREGVSKSLGKIIHMSSVHQIVPWAGHANYAASKGAINMLMESICQEYAPLKVRCNSIAPGFIKTDINKDAWDSENATDKLFKLIPYKRLGVPEDVGSTAAWLASDESEYINGTTLFVDGGMTCYPGFTTNG